MTQPDPFADALAAVADIHSTEAATAAATVSGLTGNLVDLTAQVDALTEALAGSHDNTLEVGWRCEPADYDKIYARLGAPQVSRSYEQDLPVSFAAKGYEPGCRIILSYKRAGKNLESFLTSIPKAYRVELCWEHEPELDKKVDKFPSGADFTQAFEVERQKAKAIAPHIPFVHIAAGSGYAPGKHGFDGSFIPEVADRSYCDSYLRGEGIRPFRDNPLSQRYVSLLTAAGHDFHGVCEYGRGINTSADPLADAARRIMCFWLDAQYFREIGATTLIAWCGTDWAFTDTDSIDSWTAQKRAD